MLVVESAQESDESDRTHCFNLVIEMLVVERWFRHGRLYVYLVFQSRNRDACGGEHTPSFCAVTWTQFQSRNRDACGGERPAAGCRANGAYLFQSRNRDACGGEAVVKRFEQVP